MKKRLLLLSVPSYLALKYGIRYYIKKKANKVAKALMTNPYEYNLWSFITSLDRTSLLKSVENSLRTELGHLIQRPFGSPKEFPSMDKLTFSYAQINTVPTMEKTPIDMKVIIGKHTQRPLHLSIPIMISGMAYGIALTEDVKLALAKGATLAGTVYNTGESGMLPAERAAADQLILQYNRGHWGKSPATLKQADAIELQFGQGAIGGTFHELAPDKITNELRKQFEVKRGEPIIAHARIPGINNPEDFKKTVSQLRDITDGVPIGAKIGAGDGLEKDIERCLEASLDYIAIDGAEAASKGAPPILLDDFGLPTLVALVRATNYLKKMGVRDKIDVIVSGKLLTPADFLKALAIGADAVYIGSAALFAAIHRRILKALPFDPPSQVAWYDGKYSNGFNRETGAENLGKFLSSCKEEMEMGIRALGKTSIHQLSKNDLLAIDKTVAEMAGVRMVHIPKD